jgi:hypothetical protein
MSPDSKNKRIWKSAVADRLPELIAAFEADRTVPEFV